MKIYEIGTGYTPIPAQMGAATEIVVEELTKAFLKQGVDVQIIDIAAENRVPHNLPIREVKVPGCFSGTDVQLGIMHKLKRVVYSVALAGELKRILKQETEPVVLHFHNQYNLFFFLKLVPASLRKKARIAYTVHSYIWHGKWSDIRAIVSKRYFQEIYCVKYADDVFALNGQTEFNMHKYLNVEADRIHLIDNGVNVDTYVPAADGEKDKIKTDCQLADKKVFIQVGSVCERKNQLEAIRLLLPVMKEDTNVVFCYAGGLIDGEYQEQILKFAEENQIKDQVRYLGEMKPGYDLNKLYNCAEAMVFPSKAEGFSLVILEAMSAGVPVLIGHNLHFALETCCLRYHDSASFVEIIDKYIRDPLEKHTISDQVRRSVVEQYSWDKIATDYLTAFQNGVKENV